MLAETEDIQAISYDEVSGTVTISGAFDPLLLPCKLRRKDQGHPARGGGTEAHTTATSHAAKSVQCAGGPCSGVVLRHLRVWGLQWLRLRLLRLPGVHVRQPPTGGLLQGASVGAVPKDHLRLRGGGVSCVQDHVMCLLPGLPCYLVYLDTCFDHVMCLLPGLP